MYICKDIQNLQRGLPTPIMGKVISEKHEGTKVRNDREI